MNNEIKEILDDLRKTADNGIFIVCSSQEELDKMPKYTTNFLSINDRKAKLLLDYITNLQEENEQLKKCNSESITFLNQDNIRDMLLQKDYKIFCLQQRIDKAIEYIGKNDRYSPIAGMFTWRGDTDELRNILRGEK